ncbi:MAG: DUF4037 domain-containing protein [Treponema sp.]|jgi:hypothetical protein|nr:DUF4037 domain-containing protein [Treponema sp.]
MMMKYKTKLLADRFTAILSQWPGVECISLNEAALSNTLDPYFALILDVFYAGPIPNAEARYPLYGEDVAAFESARSGKDRFLIGNMPVRLEYKSIQQINEVVSIADTKLEFLWLIKDAGTYGYYRLTQGDLLFYRSDWIHGIRERLLKLGDGFWQQMREANQSKMEHLLSDLGAAFIQEDDFNYCISAAFFIKTACLTLFCINHRFEPSHRAYHNQVLELPVLPASFHTHFEAFIRNDAEMTVKRKYSLAQIIARGIIAL